MGYGFFWLVNVKRLFKLEIEAHIKKIKNSNSPIFFHKINNINYNIYIYIYIYIKIKNLAF